MKILDNLEFEITTIKTKKGYQSAAFFLKFFWVSKLKTAKNHTVYTLLNLSDNRLTHGGCADLLLVITTGEDVSSSQTIIDGRLNRVIN